MAEAVSIDPDRIDAIADELGSSSARLGSPDMRVPNLPFAGHGVSTVVAAFSRAESAYTRFLCKSLRDHSSGLKAVAREARLADGKR